MIPLYQQKFNSKQIILSMEKFRQSKKLSLQQKKESQSSQELPGVFSTHSPQKIKQEHQSGSQSPHSYNRFPEQSLHKEVSNLRKYEETQQRLREKQAAYNHLVDMYDKVNKEKQGIETSLLHQIDMYRNLIKEIEEKAEERLRKIQQAFKEEMERKLAQKEQQMRVMQGEKDQLQNFVNELEKIGNQLQAKLGFANDNLQNTQDQLKKAEQQKKRSQQKLQAAEEQMKLQAQKSQGVIDSLKEKIINGERQWRDKLDEAFKQKQRAIKQTEKQYKEQINKIYEKHESEKNQRKQEIKNLMEGFETEKNRLNQIIAAKQRAIEQHHKESIENSNKLNNAIRGYELEIQALASQKSRLFEQVDNLNSENTQLNVLMKEMQLKASNEKKNLEAYISKLKDDISFSQTNFLRERDRNVMSYEDNTKEIVSLKKQLAALQTQNDKLKLEAGDSVTLANEVRKLRDMLLQSSYELEKCKEQFLKISKQRDYMALKFNEASYQVGSLKRIKFEKEEQARTWRDSYYMNRSRSIRR